MKKLLFLAFGLLSAAFLVSAVLSVGFLAGLDRIWVPRGGDTASKLTVSVLLPSERDPFWDSLVAALHAEGGPKRIRFEVTRYNPAGANAREVLEKATLAKVDAVLCYPPDSDDVSDVVNAAEGRGVPVLLLENDLPNSKRRVFLGASSFQMGHDVGRIIRRDFPAARRGGVLLNQTSLDRQTVRSSLFLNGLSEGLGRSSSDFSWEELISPPGRFAGEELVWGLLKKSPPVQLLVTTNAKDTTGALQSIVEANRVGRVRLIGVGEDQGLRTALDQGLVTGLLTREPVEWARLIAVTVQAVTAGKPVSSYVNLPVHALTASGEIRGN